MSDTIVPSMPRRRLPGWSWFLIVPLAVITLFVMVLALLPVQVDTPIPEEEWGVGAVNIEPAWTGLLREWPAAPPEFDPQVARLGYQLFFDPALSGDDTRSCASCHHPDWGFSEPAAISTQPDGSPAQRHTPTLWNVAYQERYFWDGRAASLEEQALEAIVSPEEMDQDVEALVAELRDIPAYRQAFDAAFPDGLAGDNIAAALSAFERTLVSDGAAFDRYAAGDMEALTAAQRRGLGVFRSAGTRCFECHAAPTFTDGALTVAGVPDAGSDDQGAGDHGGPVYAFKTPSLRNVVLRGPYMHNGSLDSLEAVVAHYAGGGQGFTLAPVDQRIHGFALTTQQTSDLLAFLYALTDETIPERYWTAGYTDSEGRVLVPASVPSGLEPIQPMPNPARARVEQFATGDAGRPECDRAAGEDTLIVEAGSSIQTVVDCALPGDTILVEPGVYHETVVIDQSDITLRGHVAEPAACPLRGDDGRFPSGEDAPDWPVLDGDIDGDGAADLTDGVIASGNDFTLEFFAVQHYSSNGVLVEGVRNVTLRHLFAADTGLYGLYPVHSTGILIECSVATQMRDSGIYAGQSRDIVMRHNLAYDSVVGIEVENSVGAELDANEVWGNGGGVLIFLLPHLTSRVSAQMDVHDNLIYDNNRSKADAAVGFVSNLLPVGTGLFVMGTDDVGIYHNTITGNHSFGIGVGSMYQAFTPEQIGDLVGPLSERVRVYDNTFSGNGAALDPVVKEAGFPGADVLWDTSGSGNTFDVQDGSVFPPLLPSARQPHLVQRIIARFWATLAKLL